MTEVSSAAGLSTSAGGSPARSGRAGNTIVRRLGSWIPTWGLITTKFLEIRKRRGLMVTVAILVLALPVLVLGLRLIFHAADPKTYGPAGSPSIFSGLVNAMAEFGFIAAAALGTAAGTTDLTDGMFRHLVVTGRSRLALYLARIPSGLAILLPLVGLAFAMVCLVTSYAGTPQPTTVAVFGATVPTGFDQAQLETWLLQNPQQAENALPPGPASPAPTRAFIERNSATIYGDYTADELAQENPAVNEMAKIGLWLELVIGVGFLVGLGLGSLLGQRTVATILMIALEIIVTPILARTAIPYFLNGQRIVVGIALDQLRPAGLAAGPGGPGGPGRGGGILLGGRGALGIPPMPTWAMIAVIVGWIVGWSVIGAWRMMTRDA
ncbi:MAG TPA: hypothetical protein VGY96_00740 [Streptosporangiaceae bacterium]|nr:hypothetical protein [Streptosporangiaceae bacterium]